MTSDIKTAPAPTSMRFTVLTLAAALTAAIAATTSASLGWPVWAMFMGWVAFSPVATRARMPSIAICASPSVSALVSALPLQSQP
ncbi:hypothetical protein LP421_00915 (plasmid) [Rhizobium sp. RCAM05350]|nr:hypothetical protein LP421_00915 [Rhizobium sp. RCAM05350]